MTEHLKPPQRQLSFKEDLIIPVAPERLAGLRAGYTEQVIERQEYLKSPLIEKEISNLQATGEYPIQTPFDALNGKPELLPPEVVVEALMTRHIDLETLLHPERIQALIEMEQKGYEPVTSKSIQVLDEAIRDREPITFANLGFGIETVEQIAHQLGIQPEEVMDSANNLFAQGTFSWTNDRLPTIPYIGSSTPDATGGAHFLETMALAQGISFVPIDSKWNNLDNQVQMWTRANELLHNDPVLEGHPYKDYLLERSQKLMGVTLKAEPKDAANRARILYKKGVRMFRVYDPRARLGMLNSVDAVRQATGNDAVIYAGQTINPEQAHKLQKAGANAVIVGIGEGGICKTPTEASLAVNNLLTGYQIIKSGLMVPVVYDAGVGPKTAIAMGIGAGGVMKSQAIGKGIEKPPFMYWYQLPDGRWGSLYSGEAAARTKMLGGKLDKLGRPLYVEGADESVVYDPRVPSTATILVYLHEALATALVFQRRTVTELQHDPQPNIYRPSQAAIESGSVHHKSG